MGFANFVGAHVEAGLKSELITSAPVVEVAPECSGSNSDFCGHTHQVTGSITVTHPGRQLLGKNTQWLLSQREHSSPTYLTPQLRIGSGASTPTTGEKTLTPTGL